MSDDVVEDVLDEVEVSQDIGPAVVRTLVPMVVGLVVGLLARAGFEVDDSTRMVVTQFVSLVVGVGYYVIARELERRWPRAGWMLGSPRAPFYEVKATQAAGYVPGAAPATMTEDNSEVENG
jgi:hypothetical protein